jgi:hypothetical protein
LQEDLEVGDHAAEITTAITADQTDSETEIITEIAAEVTYMEAELVADIIVMETEEITKERHLT